jgi:hypothetical protein
VDLGGGVETFTDARSAYARASYVHEIATALFFGETDLVAGKVVLRLSYQLHAGQVAAYKTALERVTGTTAETI